MSREYSEEEYEDTVNLIKKLSRTVADYLKASANSGRQLDISVPIFAMYTLSALCGKSRGIDRPDLEDILDAGFDFAKVINTIAEEENAVSEVAVPSTPLKN